MSKAYRIYERPVDQLVDLFAASGQRGKDFWALQDIDLTVERGEAIGVIGRNGSGKSTLLQLACGILQPSVGTITVHGRVAGLLELGAGFNREFTGRENIHLAAAVLGLKGSEIAARFGAIEEFAGIGSFIDRPVREYSSGMYARLAFSVCAHVDADILLIDEIFAVGDAAFQQRCMRYLRGFRKGGGTVLFVSHSEAAVLALCERAIWLDQGRLQADGPGRDVCRRYATALQDSGSTFQKGGVAKLQNQAIANLAARSAMSAHAFFDFDPDTLIETGEATIQRVEFSDVNGKRITYAEVGQIVELQIDCVAGIDLQNPVIVFLVRNNLGRQVFGDDTSLAKSGDGHLTARGQTLSARFRFYLPFLQTGDYSIEAFVFERAAQTERLLARTQDSNFLKVHSQHVGEGLANIPVIETKIDVHTQASADVI